MEIVKTIPEARIHLAKARGKGLSIGFVPTMGYLHDGHVALIRCARSECGYVVVSIFVNPMQFGPNEDYLTYPRDLGRDAHLAKEAGADLIFAPEAQEMYPPDFATSVDVAGLGDVLCGASRPGHFRGVATVVVKLLNIVQPHRAYFGEKDAQQLVIIRRLVSDLNIPVKVIGVPTVREPDGLALSSRNIYLSPEERRIAPVLYKALQSAEEAIERGERSASAISALISAEIGKQPIIRTEYIEVVDLQTLQPLHTLKGRVLIAVAARLGKARLIDNIALEIEGNTVSRTDI